MADYTDYIVQGALARGLDPKKALYTVDTEGGRSGRTGDSGTSFGPFQMHVGGTLPGTTAKGLGDEMLARGLNPQNPYQSIDYALDYAAAHGGFSPNIWHGLRRGGGAQPQGYDPSIGATRINVQKDIPPEADNSLLLYAGILDALGGESGKEDTSKPAIGTLQADTAGQPTPGAPARTKPEQGDELLNAIKDHLDQTHPPNQLSGQPIPGIPGLAEAGAQTAPKPSTIPGDFIEPPAQGQPAPPMPQQMAPPQTAPPQQQPTPQVPVPQQQSPQMAGLYDGVLNALKQFNPIGSAQAGETPKPAPSPSVPAPQPPNPPGYVAPSAGPVQSGNPIDSILRGLSTSPMVGPGMELLREYLQGPETTKGPGENETSLDKILTTAGVTPPASTDIQQAQAEQAAGQLPRKPIVGVGEGGELTGRLPELAEAVMSALAGPVPGGALGAGPSILRGGRRVPPPRVEPPRIGQSTDVRPFAEGGGPPAIPPTGVARVPGAEPPPEFGLADVTTTVSEPRAPKGDANESAPVKEMRLEAMHQTQDKLFQNWTQISSFQNRLLKKITRGMPRLSGEQKLQIERYLEWQPGMPEVAIDGTAKRIADEVIKPMREQAARDYAYLKKEGATENLPDNVLDDLTEGYLHRMRAPQGMERHPFEPFGGVRGLRRSTSSMKGRKFYVLQDMHGERHLYEGDVPAPYGTKMKDDYGTEVAEVRRATTEEIEKNTDVRYMHDPLLASLQNMSQLRIARKNFDLLHKDILPDLEASGLTTTDAVAARRLGMQPVQVPSLNGRFFERRLANAIDDFYKTPSIVHDEMLGAFHWLGDINRAAIYTLFLNPFAHMRNVASDYALARGDLWWNPRSYAQWSGHIKDAFTDVMRDSKFYHDVMKAGGSLMGASNETRVMYQALVNRARDDMTKLPFMDAVAKQTGVWKSAKQMAEAIWEKSQSFMWGFHDMLLLARTREIMARERLPIEQAVQKAERFIADYRVPASVGEGSLRLSQPSARMLSRIMQDRSVTVFGRYHYNKLKAIGNTIGDAYRAMTRAGIPMNQRVEAMGRLGTMLMWSTVYSGGINWILQQVTGAEDTRFSIPGAMGIPANMARVGDDLIFKQDMGQAAYDFWNGLMSIVTPMPLVLEVFEQAMNRPYPFSNSAIRPEGSSVPGGAIKSGAHAIKTLLPPVGDVLDPRSMFRSTTGISLPPEDIDAIKAGAERKQGRARRYLQRRDPLESAIGQVLQ